MDRAKAGLFVRRMFRGHERNDALAAEAAELAEYMASDAIEDPGPASSIHVGNQFDVQGIIRPLRLPISSVRDTVHASLVGGSGSGKSFTTLVLLDGLLRAGHRPLIVIDGKLGQSDLADHFLERIVPAYLAEQTPEQRRTFLDELTVVDLGGTTHLPPLHLLFVDPTQDTPVELLVAEQVAAFDATVGRGLGSRSHVLLSWLLRLAIDQGLHWPSVPRLLSDLSLPEALARGSHDQELRRFFFARFAGEPIESKLALAARLDAFLAIPTVKLALSANRGPDMRRWLSRGVTVVRLGSFGGLSSASKFVGALVCSALLRSVFARRVDERSPTALIFLDEWQSIAPALAGGEAEDALLMARAKRCHLWLITQQLSALEPRLARIIQTNTGLGIVMRSSVEDAKAMQHMLPLTGRSPRPPGAPWEKRPSSPFLTRSEERDALVEGITRLPSRHGWWWDRRRASGAVRFETRELRLPQNVPRELVEEVKNAGMVRRAELEEFARAESMRLDGLVNDQPPPERPRRRVRAREAVPEPEPDPVLGERDAPDRAGRRPRDPRLPFFG